MLQHYELSIIFLRRHQRVKCVLVHSGALVLSTQIQKHWPLLLVPEIIYRPVSLMKGASFLIWDVVVILYLIEGELLLGIV